ncbi:MAG: GNAT family N-acetyltransferase [Gammaproteobacteria bacterium]|nr:GNAT family N-acetyltransferase [Gammaproteobacteria bacterium]
MNIEVCEKEITPELMDLLLSADPDEQAILSYLPRSHIVICKDSGEYLGVAVLVELAETAEIFELKNIAVRKDCQGKGIAKSMISIIKKLAKESGAKILEVGTGNSSLSQIALYQKCGFRMHSIEPGFFDNYPEPIYENGIRCFDMVRLRVEL